MTEAAVADRPMAAHHAGAVVGGKGAALIAMLLLQAAVPLTAEEALANYRQHMGAAGHGTRCGSGSAPDEVVVCGAQTARERLPLPEQRFGPGEVVRHPSEPPSAIAPGPPGEPSRLMDTLSKLVRAAKGAITGEDPNF